ncbi:MAG: phosphoglycerate kinase, partial [Candidatus Moranbacteria bacterium]|nr:phosphoglycerate kinase [Candidatus Moranbacteria bacterium]
MSTLESFRSSQDPVALENLDLKNKNVLVRVDYNCPVGNFRVLNNFRIKESLATLRNLKEAGVKMITLITHFERPEGKYDFSLSIEPIRLELENLWGEKIVMPPYKTDYQEYSDQFDAPKFQVFMWENIRFWPEEEKNNPEFAQALAKNQDLFVNEAFSASHRKHASTVGITKSLPAYAGWHLAEEVREIYQSINKEAIPSIAIVGGAKIETKIPVLEALAKNYEKIVLGGKIAVEYEEMEKRREEDWQKKVELPIGYSSAKKFDISKESAERYAQLIRAAKKIIWNGPMGKFEEEKYRQGSEIVARAVAENKNAIRLTGGGDTVELLEK